MNNAIFLADVARAILFAFCAYYGHQRRLHPAAVAGFLVGVATYTALSLFHILSGVTVPEWATTLTVCSSTLIPFLLLIGIWWNRP